MKNSSDGKIPVILDTDIGDDIDDTWALAFMLASPELDCKLVTVACDDTPRKTRLVAKLLQAFDRVDVPIGTGPVTGNRHFSQQRWLGDYSLENYPGIIYEDGVQALVDTLLQSGEQVTLITIGPQTNVKLALERNPEIVHKARVVSMAGSLFRGWNDKIGRVLPFNVASDPAAVQAVISAGWQVTWAPLDTAGVVVLRDEDYKQVETSSAPFARTVIENYKLWDHLEQAGGKDLSSTLFDTVAIYLAFDESFCYMADMKIKVTPEGYTLEDEQAGFSVRCALAWRDLPAFKRLLVARLTNPPSG